jgi:glycosyltransferase involved in cell wall biosynthesis
MKQSVSIIVPSYNKELYISDTLFSVINQTYTNWELLVIDDVSTDTTSDIVNAIKKTDSRIIFHTNAVNKGANFCRNYGLKIAKGKFIIFLDADDILEKTCLDKRLKQIENTNTDFVVFTMQVFLRKVGDSISIWKPNSKKPLNDFLFHKLPWQTMQPIWKTDFLRSLGGFNEDFKRMQDVELHTRALLVENVLYKQVIDKPDCYYRIDEDRKDLNTFQFMSRWIDAALMYVQRFQFLPKENKKYLIGTIYETYIQLLFQFKTHKITSEEFAFLEKKTLNPFIKINKTQYVLLSISKFYNLKLIRIPGINKILKQLLILFSS